MKSFLGVAGQDRGVQRARESSGGEGFDESTDGDGQASQDAKRRVSQNLRAAEPGENSSGIALGLDRGWAWRI